LKTFHQFPFDILKLLKRRLKTCLKIKANFEFCLRQFYMKQLSSLIMVCELNLGGHLENGVYSAELRFAN